MVSDNTKQLLKIALCSSEMEPFARTGGLGDVVAALSKNLARRGHEVKVFLPKFRSVYQTGIRCDSTQNGLSLQIAGTDYPLSWEVYRDRKEGFEVVFIVNDDLFLREQMYTDRKTGLDFDDNDTRFIFFNRAVLEVIVRMKWSPDIVHVNDWQAGLIPAYLKTLYADDDHFSGVRSALTIHNAAYQGIFSGATVKKLGVAENFLESDGPFSWKGKLNFLQTAISNADVVSAVSERYAMEIQSSGEYGCGLEDVLRKRNTDLFGILNGVDYEVWNPESDKLIASNYSAADISGKAKNKTALQKRLGLPEATDLPLIGMVTRLAEQKGIELFLEIADDLLGLDLQIVVLGEGMPAYVAQLQEVQKRHPERFRLIIGFDNPLAHLIEAGSDIFLMPSRYEPCGLNQMYSLRYGAIPVVRETGGLADTVSDYDHANNSGVGFVFRNFSSDELLEAMCRALDLYKDKARWQDLMLRGMRLDFSWESSVVQYESLYRKALSRVGDLASTETV